jgi:hypothetical protein
LRKLGSGTLLVLDQSDIPPIAAATGETIRILYSRFSRLPARQLCRIDATRRIADWRAGVNWQLTRAVGLWPIAALARPLRLFVRMQASAPLRMICGAIGCSL